MFHTLIEAGYENIKIVFTASIFTILIGVPIGVFLEATSNKHILGDQYLWIHDWLRRIINFTLNIPIFLILITLTPIINHLLYENFTIQFSITIVLSIVGIVILANHVFISLNNLPKELSDTAKFLGAEPIQILTKFLLPQAVPQFIQNITHIIIKLFNLSIIASILGTDGLGKIALEKGFQEFDLALLFYVIIFSIAVVYILKFLGFILVNYIENKYHKPNYTQVTNPTAL